MASVDVQRGAYFLADDRSARLAAAEGALTKVLSLAPNHAMARYLFGFVQVFSNRAAQGTKLIGRPTNFSFPGQLPMLWKILIQLSLYSTVYREPQAGFW